MIGQLSGTLLIKQPPALLLDVQGVGYELEAPMTTFYELPEEGSSLTLLTHLVVREDAQLLFGFSSVPQRDLFRMLLRVSGIGPRVALAILSGLSVQEFSQCVNSDNVARLIKVPGIGRKTAERVILELRDKPIPGLADGGDVAQRGSADDARNDAVSALAALGYKSQLAEKVVSQLADQASTSEALIRLALQSLSGVSR
jgi:Holliday junction DNA helicase RuvA